MNTAYRTSAREPEPPKKYRRRLTDQGRRLLWLPTSTMGYGMSQLLLMGLQPRLWILHLILGVLFTAPWLPFLYYVWRKHTCLEEVMPNRTPP